MNNVKQVIVIRKDLNMRKGKMIAQGAHAAILAYQNSSQKSIHFWELNGSKKICVSVYSLKQLDMIYELAKNNNIVCSYIVDSGLTEFNCPTPTAICLGPEESDIIDKITGDLKLL